MTSPRTLLTALGLVAALALGTGCSAAPGADQAIGDREGQEVADAVAHQEADELAADLASVSWLEQARYLEAQVPPDPPGVDGSRSEVRRELLASSRSTDEDGAPVFTLTVRIRVHFVPADDSGWDWDPPREATVARCFDLVVAHDADVEPEEADCPDGGPLPVDADVRIPARPWIHPRDRRAVRAFLRDGGGPSGTDRLAARLGRGLTPVVEESGGTTAVAVTARPDGDDCVVGRRTADGEVTVWTPDRVLTMPGEYGCTPQVALDLPPGYVAGA